VYLSCCVPQRPINPQALVQPGASLDSFPCSLVQEILFLSGSGTESKVEKGLSYQALLTCPQEATPNCAQGSRVRLVTSTASSMWHSQVGLSNRVINCNSNY